MTALGMGGSALPRTKPGDYDRALALVAGLGDDNAVKAKLIELRNAEAANNVARENAEGAIAESKQREAAAMEAEDNARSQRAALATATEEADKRIRAERAELATERQHLTELADDLEAKELDLTRREAALRTAFDAYTGATI